MPIHKCQFCDSDFSSRSNLTYHQANTKYCLEKQGIMHNFNCESCKKNFQTQIKLVKHYTKCIDYQKLQLTTHYEKIILELKQANKKLQRQLAHIALKAASKPTVTNTDNRVQTINNLIPITDDHLKEQAKFLTIEHIKQGALGYANFACEYALKDRVICVDCSRRKIKYKNSDGQVITDPEMTTLARKLFTALDEKNTELISRYKSELRDIIMKKYRDASGDMTDIETKELDIVIDQINRDIQEASTLNEQTRDIAAGKKPEIYHDFIREVCNQTIGT